MVSLSPRHPMTMENLPCDVLSKIFILLLAKQLAQMRCVCKSWNALLSESSFIKSHLHRSFQNNNGILLYFHQSFLHYYNTIRERPIIPSYLDLEPTHSIKLPVNTQSKTGYGSVIGSVNGLICFKYGSNRDDYAVLIWNPSLSAVLTLPPCSFPSLDSDDIHFRFGFDPITDGYKVVKVTQIFGPVNILPQVEVYSMRKGSWDSIGQKLETYPLHVTRIFHKDEVCADGHDGYLHWLGFVKGKRDYDTIVEFDLGAETFHEIPLPDIIRYEPEVRWNVFGVLAGKFCLMSKKYVGKCEVWVMNDEYGVPESWVKYQALPEFRGDWYPDGFTSHNEFIFSVNDKIYLYDPIADQTKTFKITDRNHTKPPNIVEYVDSLVWVAPAKHELSKGQVLSSTLNSHQLLKGLQKDTHQLHFFYILLPLLCMICFLISFLSSIIF